MRKLILALTVSILSFAGAQAFWPEATASLLEVGVGYRQDTVKWKTKADLRNSYSDSCSDSSEGPFGGVDGLRSDVSWKNVNIWQIEAKGKYITCDNVYVRLSADYGWATGGKHKHKDYLRIAGVEDSAEFELYSDNSSKVRGHVYDVKFALGYQFQLCDNSFSLTPLVGYSWHGQHFKNGGDDYGYGSYSGEDYSSYSYDSYSSYSYYDSYSSGSCGSRNRADTRWNGAFLGFDFDYVFGCGCESDWNLFGSYEFHWADFHGKTHRNFGFLGEADYDGVNSYQHAKNAYGNIFDIGLRWDLCDCWTVALKGAFQWWWADSGRERHTFFDEKAGDVGFKCSASQHLHDVKWDSAAISIDVGMVF